MAKKYILVAEDDDFYGKIYTARLKNEGFDVFVAPDGEQALKAIRQRRPDLILLDLIMPVKDGFETLKELKSDPKLKNIPVLILTNLSQEDDIERVKKLGAKEYIVKTDLSVQEMVDKIKSYL